jgi:hypothetical protein
LKGKEQRTSFSAIRVAIAQRSSPALASNRANRHTVEHAAAAPAGDNRRIRHHPLANSDSDVLVAVPFVWQTGTTPKKKRSHPADQRTVL